jgi:cytidylate kinase
MLAAQLGYTFVDAGQLYRAVAKQVLLRDEDPRDEEAVVRLVAISPIKVQHLPGDNRPTIIINGEDLHSQNLHNTEINLTVPIIAAYPSVRTLIRQIQHQIAAKGRVVLAGRDIGTVVLPNADLKIFLIVSIEERARRRYNSLSHVADITNQQILEDLKRRDELDSTRSHSPMRIAQDAVAVETDGMEPQDVVDHMITIANNRSGWSSLTSSTGLIENQLRR